MSNFNNVTLMGRIANDLELTKTKNDKDVLNFTVAVNDGYGENESVNFFNCVAWNKTAVSLAGNKKKGELILVNGKLSTDQYEKDGQKRTVTKVIAFNVVFMPGGGKSKEESSSEQDFDEIPF